jgi:hypothetical protein
MLFSATGFSRQILSVATLPLVCGLLACGGGGQPSAQPCPSLPGPATSGLGSIVDVFVANEMKAQGLVGMFVAIAKKGKILYTQGYGYADLSTCQAVQPATEFQIGSLTKQFTAAALLRFVEWGSPQRRRTGCGLPGELWIRPADHSAHAIEPDLRPARLSWFPGGKLVAQGCIGANRSQPDRTSPAVTSRPGLHSPTATATTLSWDRSLRQ